MDAQKWEKFEKNLARFRVQGILIAILIVASVGLVGTLAWGNLNQRALNPTFETLDYAEVEVEKYGVRVDEDGEIVDEIGPLADAFFQLFMYVDGAREPVEYDVRGVAIGESTKNGFRYGLRTDEYGNLTQRLLLPAGDFCLVEIEFPVGFGAMLNEEGVAISETCFSIESRIILDEYGDEVEDSPRLIVIFNHDVEEESKIYEDDIDNLIRILNRELRGEVEVEKILENEDGTSLTDEQLTLEFEFEITFWYDYEDEDEYDGFIDYYVFSIDNREAPVYLGTLESGDTFYLRHGQVAVFVDLPIGITYVVNELIPENFRVNGNGTKGDIREDITSRAEFTNYYIPEEEGNLIVEKRVRSVDSTTVNTDLEFMFRVYFYEENAQGQMVWDRAWAGMLSDHERSPVFSRPIGTPYRVVEVLDPSMISTRNITEGQLLSGTVHVIVDNVHRPEDPEPEGDLIIRKNVIGNPTGNPQFNFTLTLSNIPSLVRNNTAAVNSFNDVMPTAFNLPLQPLIQGFEVTGEVEGIVGIDDEPIAILENDQEPEVTEAPHTEPETTVPEDLPVLGDSNEDEVPPCFDIVRGTTRQRICANDPRFAPYFTTASNGTLIFTHEFTMRHGEQIQILGLPYGVLYDVVEDSAPNFIQRYTRVAGEIVTGNNHVVELEFVNQYQSENELEEPSMEVCKVLTDNDLDNDTTFHFEFVIIENGQNTVYTRFTVNAGECITFVVNPEEALTANPDGNYSLVSLPPIGTHFRIREVNIPVGYRFVTSTREFGTISHELIEMVFTNELVLIDIPIVKIWDLNDVTGIDKPDRIVVELLRNGILDRRIILTIENEDDESTNWLGEFIDLPRYDTNGSLINWQVRERPVSGWIVSEERDEDGFGWTITNTAIVPVEVDVPIQKTFTTLDGTPDDRPFEFVIRAVTPENVIIPQERIIIEGSGTGIFEDIKFTDAGTFVLEVREIISDAPDVEYDSRTFLVTFVVEMDDNGELNITANSPIITVDGSGTSVIAFRNYEVEPPTEPPTTEPTTGDDSEPTTGDDTEPTTGDDSEPTTGDDTEQTTEDDEPGTTIGIVIPTETGSWTWSTETDPEGTIGIEVPTITIGPSDTWSTETDPDGTGRDPSDPPITTVPTDPRPTDRPTRPTNAPADTTPGATRPPQSQPPQTGDDTMIMIWISLIGLSSVALVLLNMRRRMAHDEES